MTLRNMWGRGWGPVSTIHVFGGVNSVRPWVKEERAKSSRSHTIAGRNKRPCAMTSHNVHLRRLGCIPKKRLRIWHTHRCSKYQWQKNAQRLALPIHTFRPRFTVHSATNVCVNGGCKCPCHGVWLLLWYQKTNWLHLSAFGDDPHSNLLFFHSRP